MSDHSLAFVPLGTGYVQSTDLFARGRPVDTGLLAEALIYYDRLMISVENPHQFSSLVSYLIQQGLTVANINALFRDGVFGVYDFAFHTNPYVDFQPDGIKIHGLYNLQDQTMLKPNSFVERYVEFEPLIKVFDNRANYNEFTAALEGRVIEVKADEIGASAIENAYQDFLSPERNSLMTQQLVNEIYRIKKLGKPPKIQAYVQNLGQGEYKVTWNVRLNRLPAVEVEANIIGADTLPLSTAAQANKYLWAAQRLNCDLYLERPVSALVGDKLFEAGETAVKQKIKSQNIIEELQLKVEFPDLRSYVNLDKIDFGRVLEIRRKATKFRQWLQSESERDREAIWAYHREVARASGFANVARHTLKLFGAVGGAAIGASVGASLGTDTALGAVKGAAVGAGVGEGVAYLSELAASVGNKWSPVVFGEWYSTRIAKLLKDSSEE
jgi:hypothetical protein